MSNIKGHKIGILATITLTTIVSGDPAIILPLIPGIVIGGVLPDLDAEHSYIKHYCKTLGKLYSKLPRCRLFGQEGYNHRSLLLHSIFTLIILLALSYYLESKVILGMFFGVLSHHVLDWPIRRYWKI